MGTGETGMGRRETDIDDRRAGELNVGGREAKMGRRETDMGIEFTSMGAGEASIDDG